MMKTDLDENDKKLSKYLKALSHPIRLSIIKTLMDRSSCPHGIHPCSCGENCRGKNCKCGCKCGTFVDMFDISQSTVSQHIKELKAAGLIELKSRKGDYTLNHSKLRETLELLQCICEYPVNGFQKNEKCKCCS